MTAKRTREDDFFEGLGGALGEDSPVREEDLESGLVDPVREDSAQEKAAQQSLRPVTRGNLFSHPEAHPYVLDMALLRTFQFDWFQWDPEVLFYEIEKTFKTSIAEVNRNKLLVITALHISDVFWDAWEVFEKGVLSLNGIVPRLHDIQPPDLPALYAGVDIANSIRQEEYGEEVGRYAAACFLSSEVSYAPDVMAFCQPYLSQPRYHCTECDKKGSALPPFDGHCDVCSRKYTDDKPLNFKPAKDAKDDVTKVKYYLTLDPAPTKSRFEVLASTPPEELKIEETAEDVEAAKLISAFDYMHFRRQQRDRQLSEIKDWMIT